MRRLTDAMFAGGKARLNLSTRAMPLHVRNVGFTSTLCRGHKPGAAPFC